MPSVPRSGAGKAHGLASAGLGLRVEFHRGELGHLAASSFSSPLRFVILVRDRLVDEHRAVVGAQAGLGDLLHLLRRHVEDALHGGQGELRVAEQDGVPAQFVRAARDRAEPVQPLALQLGLGALHFLGRGALLGEPGELLVDGGLDDRHLDVP